MEEASTAAQEEQQQQPTSDSLLLSFENPNYQFEKQLKNMDQARIDDHLNSNIEPNMYEELCNELKIYTELSGEGIENKSNRWTYAHLNSQTMGVLSSPQMEKEVSCEKEPISKDSPAQQLSSSKQGDLTEGWEMHEDEGGLYFWHVKSGTIQREIPKAFQNTPTAPVARLSKSSTSSNISKSHYQQSTSSSSSSGLASSSAADNVEQKRKSLPPSASLPITDEAGAAAGMQVRVKSLGSIQLSEESLTNENSSRAVNRCIVQLSSNTTSLSSAAETSKLQDLNDHQKDLILSLNEGTLKLIDPESGAVVNAQPIHTIRVWGVGRDDSRDFAYVARDKATRCHTCHVFRCDVPARAIANKLRDICKKILIERSLTQSSAKLMDKDQHQLSRKDSTSSRSSATVAAEDNPAGSGGVGTTASAPTAPGSNLIRPTHFTTKLKTKTVSRAPDSFPTPMEEPKKIIKARFIGEVEVDKPGGMETINEAIALSESRTSESEWELVNVGVAPSTITITFTDSKRSPIDCRVRFLSFLGIGQDMRKCAFIVHTAQDTFIAYAFHCEPHSGPLCKTVEAACTLRYQKCLDARPQRLQSPSPEKKGIGLEGQPARHPQTTIKKALKTIFFGSSSSSSSASS